MSASALVHAHDMVMLHVSVAFANTKFWSLRLVGGCDISRFTNRLIGNAGLYTDLWAVKYHYTALHDSIRVENRLTRSVSQFAALLDSKQVNAFLRDIRSVEKQTTRSISRFVTRLNSAVAQWGYISSCMCTYDASADGIRQSTRRKSMIRAMRAT